MAKQWHKVITDQEITVKYIKLSYNAVEPSRSHEDDAGWDLTAIRMETIDHGTYGYLEYGTGLAIEIPPGFVGKLYARSSISNTGLILANSVGIIDASYRGELIFRFKWIKDSKRYEIGDRVGQIIIERLVQTKWEIVTELSSSSRNENGFGSSGN